ncbi:MAG TPA: acyltransferase [Solirubrobacteraceae bacterium]|nr:acyltransferase [Solirubrobacteraceae bacterium]
MASPDISQPAPATPLARGYRPWLDGVRAVAVLMVVAQHVLGHIPVDLGFVGVGLFFALSGYLITSLLLDERSACGSVSLRSFYLRRGARLFPALLLVVLVCNALFLLQGDYGPLTGSLTALTYTANYAQILKPDLVPGYGPTWTLAVEEHFYVVWPLVLLWVTDRYGLRTALKATLAVCVAAFLWRAALALIHAPYSLVGIGSLERADALLYGCAAAIAVRLGWRPRTWVTLAGVVTIAVLPIAFRHETYDALVVGNVVLAVAGAAVVVGLDYAAPAWLRGALSLRPLVVVGLLSYGIYLWHGPLMRIAAEAGFSGRWWRVVVAVVAIAFAALSFRYLEAPVRAWARRRSPAPARVVAPETAARGAIP